jgi:DNA-binding FrmR family transcriptional regulator
MNIHRLHRHRGRRKSNRETRMNENQPHDAESAPAPDIHGLGLQSFYPDHKSQLDRLARIEGQIKGISRMIEQRRYCIDIVSQIKAVQSALKQVQMGVLEKHIHHCVAESARSSDPAQLNQKIEEIVQVVSKLD